MSKQKKIPTIKDKNTTCPYCKDLRRVNKRRPGSGGELLVHGHVQLKKTVKYFAIMEKDIDSSKSVKERINELFQDMGSHMGITLEERRTK